MAYGLSFQPSEDNKRGASGSPKVGTQDAVQLLSLRMPRVTGGAQSVAPQSLLDAPGGAGFGGMSPDKNSLLQWLKRLLASSDTEMPPQVSGSGGDMAAIQPGLGGAPGGAAPSFLSTDYRPSITLGTGPVGDSGPGFGRAGSALPPPPTGGGDMPPLAPEYYAGPSGGGDLPPLAPSYYGAPDPFDV